MPETQIKSYVDGDPLVNFLEIHVGPMTELMVFGLSYQFSDVVVFQNMLEFLQPLNLTNASVTTNGNYFYHIRVSQGAWDLDNDGSYDFRIRGREKIIELINMIENFNPDMVQSRTLDIIQVDDRLDLTIGKLSVNMVPATFSETAHCCSNCVIF